MLSMMKHVDNSFDCTNHGEYLGLDGAKSRLITVFQLVSIL